MTTGFSIWGSIFCMVVLLGGGGGLKEKRRYLLLSTYFGFPIVLPWVPQKYKYANSLASVLLLGEIGWRARGRTLAGRHSIGLLPISRTAGLRGRQKKKLPWHLQWKRVQKVWWRCTLAWTFLHYVLKNLVLVPWRRCLLCKYLGITTFYGELICHEKFSIRVQRALWCLQVFIRHQTHIPSIFWSGLCVAPSTSVQLITKLTLSTTPSER